MAYIDLLIVSLCGIIDLLIVSLSGVYRPINSVGLHCVCSVPLKFWATLVRNPEYLFDVIKSETVESNLTVLAQVVAFLSHT